MREKRGNKKFKSFDRVPCWFVNNSISYGLHESDGVEKIQKNDYQPEIIKVDILLNILWLSNPNIGFPDGSKDISDTGLSCLVSSTLIETMPKNAIIKELDDNINKYASQDLTPEQVIKVAKRIANKQIDNLQGINDLAKENKEEFVNTLQKEANKQQEIENKRIEQIENILKELEIEKEKTIKQNKSTNEIQIENQLLRNQLKESNTKQSQFEEELSRLKAKEAIREEKERKNKISQFYSRELFKWRKKSWIEFGVSLLIFIVPILYILFLNSWDFKITNEIFNNLKSNIIISLIIAFVAIIFSSVIIKTLFNKYRNHSNIKAYKETLDIPEDLKKP